MNKKIPIKKVLFLQTFPLWGCGSGTHTRELAFQLNHTKKVNATIVCPEGKEKIAGLKIYPLDLPFPVVFNGHPEWPVYRKYKDLSPKEIAEVCRFFLNSVVRAVEDFQPDVLHVQHTSILLWVANVIKSLYNINFIVTVHGTGIMAAQENKIYINLTQDALRKAKEIIVVSQYTKNKFLEIFGKDLIKKAKVIPGGIHLENFPLQKEIKIINKKYNLEGKKIVLFTGRITTEKGVFYLIKAAKSIKGEVFIIGDGPEKQNLEDLSRKLKLENVHFLGYMGNERREEFVEFYYRADVFVAPSVCDEALGLVILEAMACKTPVIATCKGGVPSVIKDKVNGLLIRPKNPQEIAKACNKVLLNETLGAKMAEAARVTVEKKFTWEKIGQRYLRMYKKHALNGKNGIKNTPPQTQNSTQNVNSSIVN